MFRIWLSVCLLISSCALSAVDVGGQEREIRDEPRKPLSRVREGGTPYDPNQILVPYPIDFGGRGIAGGEIASPAEYEPVKGVLYKYSSNAWPQVVTDLVTALTSDPQHDEIAYVVVTSTSQRNSATNAFAAAGADLSKVEFLIHPSNSIWMRDYGPHFIRRDGTNAIVDSHYYPTRASDNFIPTLVGDVNFNVPTADMGLYYSGGNFQPGPNRSGFVTSLVSLDNPVFEGFDLELIEELYEQFQGVDTLHVLPQLPGSVDGTGHIDMWMYLIDEDTVIISEFIPGSNPTAISITDNAVPYMESLGFTVHRPKAWNSGGTHYTYANAFRVNDRIFVPVYGTALAPGGNPAYNDEDAEAFAIWQTAAGPEIEIIPIQCSSIIPASGAIHCIVKQVPRYVDLAPAVTILRPEADEIRVAGTAQTLQWSAIDTDNAAVDSVDLYYSIDDGGEWVFIANAAGSGSYQWTTPAVNSSTARIRIVAHAADGDTTEQISNRFTISPGTETVYDFANGAGIDHRGFGFETFNWATVNGDSSPVNIAVSNANLSRMSTSNANGGDGDNNRYIANRPALNRETTHVFEFTINESLTTADAIEIHWEGYADRCTQCEMYLWDNEQQLWGDGTGRSGQNRYLDSWAGNQDGYLDGVVTGDLSSFVDENGILRILIYGDRDNDETFHDYMKVSILDLDNNFAAESFTVVGGLAFDGDLASLFENDDDALQLHPVAPAGNPETPLQLEVESTLDTDSPAALTVSIETSVNTPNLLQSVEFFNYQSGTYEELDSRAMLLTDTTIDVVASGDISRFAESGTGAVQVRLNFRATGAVLIYPWRIEIDRISWTR